MSTLRGAFQFNSDTYNSFINPYREINRKIYNDLENSSIKDAYEFVPLIHPMFDTNEEIMDIINLTHAKALKIHGVACGLGPYQISKEKIELFRKLNLPIIVHTDYAMNANNLTSIIRNMNNPFDWAMFFINNDLKGYITHGARLDIKTINLINKHDNLVLGIGPDYKINCERERWINKMENIDFLKIIRENVDINKIMFDVDFSWNICENKTLDYNQHDRIKDVFNRDEQEKIYSLNAKRFFNC